MPTRDPGAAGLASSLQPPRGPAGGRGAELGPGLGGRAEKGSGFPSEGLWSPAGPAPRRALESLASRLTLDIWGHRAEGPGSVSRRGAELIYFYSSGLPPPR